MINVFVLLLEFQVLNMPGNQSSYILQHIFHDFFYFFCFEPLTNIETKVFHLSNYFSNAVVVSVLSLKSSTNS